MTSDRDRVRPTLWATFVLGLFIAVYVLSYAPVYRVCRDHSWASTTNGIAFYRPVDWLIDNTSLNEPLYRWAGCWGVRGDFAWGWVNREFTREEFTEETLEQVVQNADSVIWESFIEKDPE